MHAMEDLQALVVQTQINASFSIQYLGSTYLLIMPWTHTVSMAHIHRMQALVSMQFPWHYGFGLGLFSPIASPSSMTQDYRVHKPCPWPVAKLCTIIICMTRTMSQD